MDEKKIARSYMAGLTKKDIMRATGLSLKQLDDVLSRQRALKRTAPTKVSDDDKALMAELYRQGKGLPYISERFNVDYTTARKWLLREGVELRGRGRPKKELPKARVERYLKEGYNVTLIADLLDTSPKVVRRFIKEGIKKEAV